MVPSLSNIILLVMINVLILCKSQEVKNEGRDFHSYLPPDENKIPDYQTYQYPHNYPFKEDYAECAKNPMLPLLGKGLNLLLLKLGLFGIIKAIMALVFVGFLMKLPLLLLKVTLLKSLFLPLLVAPLLVTMLTSLMQSSNESASENKPANAMSEIMTGMKPGIVADMMAGMKPGIVADMMAGMKPGIMSGIMPENEMPENAGRQLNENLTTIAWQSMKMFAESDQCVEKISCMIGASSRDSSIGNIFTRILKYLHHSSPATLQKRVTSIREAFNKGARSSTCSPEEYECQSPELLLQYGIKKLKIL